LLKIVFTYFVFFTALIFNTAKCQYKVDSFLQLKGADRYYELYHTYGFFIKNKPQLSALNSLVDKKGDASDKLLKYYWLEKRPILDSNMFSEKGISIYKELIEKAEQIPNYYLVAGYYMTMGVIYNKLKKFNKSFESQLLCLETLEKDPDKKYFDQCWWLHLVANKFYEFKDYSKAARLAIVASTLNAKYTPDGVWFGRVNSNLVGMSYLKNGQYDSAIVWLEKTRTLALAGNDSTWLGIATGNLGTVYYLQNNCKAAIQNYLQAIPLCKKGDVWDNVASFCNNLADCYFVSGNYQAIPALISQSEQANKKDIQNNAYLANQIKLYSIAETYYRKMGNSAITLQYTDSVKKYQILYNNAFDIAEKIKAEGEFAYKSKELQNKLLLNQNKLQKQTLWFAYIAALLIGIFIIFYIKRINLRKKLAEKNKELAEQQLATSKKEIVNFTQHLIEKNTLIESYLLEINALKKQTENLQQDQTETLQQLKTGTILTNEDWSKFKELFDKLYPEFFSTLKTNYPDLTQAEMRFLAFTKLEVLPKEMASLLGVSDQAIRTIRYRLKKKFSLTDGKEIEQAVLYM
jgi:uncharacterized membrane-anchored protein YhcB (DUF1043 family)